MSKPKLFHQLSTPLFYLTLVSLKSKGNHQRAMRMQSNRNPPALSYSATLSPLSALAGRVQNRNRSPPILGSTGKRIQYQHGRARAHERSRADHGSSSQPTGRGRTRTSWTTGRRRRHQLDTTDAPPGWTHAASDRIAFRPAGRGIRPRAAKSRPDRIGQPMVLPIPPYRPAQPPNDGSIHRH